MVSNQGKTVLIVDDVAFVRKALKQILTSHGYRVIGEAENGEEAIALANECNPDLITMDLVMPVMNGVEATRKILAQNPNSRIVVLSAMMQENLVTESILAGARDYIVKPFHTEEVIRVLQKVLDEEVDPFTIGLAGNLA